MTEVQPRPSPMISPTISPTISPAISEERFLAWAARRDGRFELVEGRVMMQAGATRAHERIAKRVFAELYEAVDETAFDVNKGDFGVRVLTSSGRGTILYPDVVVDRQDGADAERATATPIVVIEVLSPSTDFDHHVEKLERYKSCPTLELYLVFEQARPSVYVWRKTPNEGWPDKAEHHEGPDAVIELSAIGARLMLADIYRPPGASAPR